MMILCLFLISCGSNEGTPENPPTVKNDPQQEIQQPAETQNIQPNDNAAQVYKPIIGDTSVDIENMDYPMPSGRVISVLITGIDSRLGEKTARADANHLVRFFLDSGQVEVISVPRSTYADAKFTDPRGQLIGNVRLTLGRDRYMKEIRRVTEVNKIDFFVEFGFSQAMGIIEIMGYKDNASNALRVIRSRKVYAAGDKQRSYNQGQFIRQAILRTFDYTDDLMGQLGIRAALALSTTNLSYDAASYILDEMRAHGFSSNTPERIWVRMMPKTGYNMKVFDYDSSNISNIEAAIESKVQHIVGKNDRKQPEYYANILRGLLAKVEKDTNKPERVIDSLVHPFKQKSWIQIQNVNERITLRDKLCYMLVNAYNKKGKTAEAFEIVKYIEQEDEFRKSGTMK
ncbi:MAG: LytR family transcriptional regulator [Ignavibacteria bacterium]|nr:LytR family transcriptional regulator [Ignavibacteria bacterium]